MGFMLGFVLGAFSMFLYFIWRMVGDQQRKIEDYERKI
jgi:hypothetical protein